ncbi:MAG: type III polyketide synthase [Planctomycetaceae bacterium]
MTSLQILGLGTALPPHRISQSAAAMFAATCVHPDATDSGNPAAVVEALYRRAGIRYRHSVLLESSDDGEATAERFYRSAADPDDRGPGTAERMRRYESEAPDLAVRAASAALQQSRIDPAALTHLITASCSGFSAPGVDLHLINALGLPPATARTHVGFMGCHASLNALRIAAAFAGDRNATILVCAVELCSLHHQYGWNPQKLVANSLFADGAAAVVCRGCEQSADAEVTKRVPGRLTASGSFLIPETTDMMTWRIGDAGFEMTLSPEVPAVIMRTLPIVMRDFLQPAGLVVDDIASWAVHPGGPRILAAVAEALRLTDEHLAPSVEILQRCGNMSSPTILFIVELLRQQQAELPCVLLGFGPGLNVELALLT